MSRPTIRQIATAGLELINSGVAKTHIAETMAAYLLSERRTKELDKVARAMMELRAQAGVYEAVTVSAHPLTADINLSLERLVKTQHPKATRVIMQARHDLSLIGGIRLEADQLQLDTTVRNRLRRLTHNATTNT